MDDLDKKIKKVLTKNIKEPLNYEQIIKGTLQNKNAQHFFYSKLVRAIGVVCAGILLTTGVVFASYNIYERIWKEPKQYTSYEEYKENNEIKIKNDKISRAVELEKAKENGEIISEEEAVASVNRILSNLGYDMKMTKDNIIYDDVDSKHSYELYYVFTTNKDASSGIEVKLGANGKIYSFVDKNLKFNYEINPDDISEEKAIELGKQILDKINLKDKYIINSSEEISHLGNGEEKKEWWITYVKNYEGVINNYDNLELDFFVENGKLRIEQILTNPSQYSLENNEIVLEENKAIEIAKEMDRKISELEIKDVKINLEFRPLNSFIYLQEKSQGRDDGLENELQDNGTNVVYNQYDIDSKSLRKVYNVKITYDIDFTEDEPVHNWKEQFGREYFVDVTTGEIIGGRWGDNLY